MFKHVFESFQKKGGSFIKVFHQSEKLFLSATATEKCVTSGFFGFTLNPNNSAMIVREKNGHNSKQRSIEPNN